MCKTHKIANQLGLTILQQRKGGQVLPVQNLHHAQKLPGVLITDLDLEDGVYVVQQGDRKLILKTGNINPNEVSNMELMRSKGIRVPQVIDHQAGEYILEEYIGAPFLATKDFWSDENVKRVLDWQIKMLAALDRPLTTEEQNQGVEWVESKFKKPDLWLQTLVPAGVLSQTEADNIVDLFDRTQSDWNDIVFTWIDSNAEHFVDFNDDLGIVDVELVFRPRGFVRTRYLAWTLLRAPLDQIGDPVEWAKKWLEYLGNDRKYWNGLLLGLVGILWDMYVHEKHKGTEDMDRTGEIKQVLDFVVDRLKQDPETSSG